MTEQEGRNTPKPQIGQFVPAEATIGAGDPPFSTPSTQEQTGKLRGIWNTVRQLPGQRPKTEGKRRAPEISPTPDAGKPVRGSRHGRLYTALGIGGGIATAATVAAILMERNASGSNDPETGGNIPTVTLTVEPPKTEQPTLTPTATPTPTETATQAPTEAPKPPFLPDAIRYSDGGNGAVGVTAGMPTRTECPDPTKINQPDAKIACPAVKEVVPNERFTAEERIKRTEAGINKIMAFAWAKNTQGYTDETITAENIPQILADFEKAKESGPIKIDGIMAFTEKDGYENPEITYINSDYKIEWLLQDQPDKRVFIDIAQGYKGGIAVNHQDKVITLSLYSITGEVRPTYYKGDFGQGMALLGYLLSSRDSQLNGRASNYVFSQEAPQITSVAEEFVEKPGGSTPWEGLYYPIKAE